VNRSTDALTAVEREPADDKTVTVIITDRVSRELNAIGRVRPSVRLFVSTPAFEPTDFDLDFWHVYGS